MSQTEEEVTVEIYLKDGSLLQNLNKSRSKTQLSFVLEYLEEESATVVFRESYQKVTGAVMIPVLQATIKKSDHEKSELVIKSKINGKSIALLKCSKIK